MATKGSRVKPSQVAEAYGETLVEDVPEEKPIIESTNCAHEVADTKKAIYQYQFGSPVVCKICDARLKLVWVQA